MKQLNLPDITKGEIARTWSKAQWKIKVKESIKYMCKDILRKDRAEFKNTKGALFHNEKFGKKEYMKTMILELNLK